MKTAVQELIEDLLSGKITEVLRNQQAYIDKERGQIIEAHICGYGRGCIDYQEGLDSMSGSIEYYNETYSNQEGGDNG